MNELNGVKKTITTLEISEMLGVKHYKVLEKLEGTKDRKVKGIISVLTDHNFVVSDYFILSAYKDGSGKENKCYLVTKLGCDFIANKFTGEKGILFTAKYVKRFNEMEERERNQYQLPTTYKEALLQLIEQVEKVEQLENERKLLLPKAEYHDEVLNKEGLIATGLIAKDLGCKSAQKLNQIMFLNGIIFNKSGVWCPYADFEWLISDGYADFESYPKRNAKLCLKWTEKGRKWIIENYNKWVKCFRK